MSAGKPIIVAVHGILSGLTSPAWTSDFAHRVWQRGLGYDVMQRHYVAGPFPHFNVWLLNRFIARYLAAELKPYAEDGAELNFVAHSNGADITVKTIRRLARLGIKVNAAIFIAGAISCDVRRNGLEQLLTDGALGRAIAYCSAQDLALRSRLTWPYGHLGRLGFRREGKPFPASAELAARVMTRWADGGHCGYFTPENMPTTFGRILEDLNPVPF
jgi:hypothetical protein